jgi:hypothetical protein
MIVEAEGANPDAFAIRTARESVPGNRFQQLPPLETKSYSISPAIRSMQSSPSSTACCISIIALAAQARVVRNGFALLGGQR